MANQFLGLSLFIMLLSFFIILNTMSNFEEIKSRPVLNSISVAFSKNEIEEDAAPSFDEDQVQSSFREGDTLDRLEELFRSQITGLDVQKNRMGTVMHIQVSLQKFEKGIMAPVQTGQQRGAVLGGIGGSFAPVLVSVLRAEDAVIPYRLDMILNMEQNPAKFQNERPQDMNAKIRKVAAFAEKLEEAGLPKKLVTSGVGQGKEGTIDLFFRRYEQFNPLGELKSRVEP